jgi:GNAT superfamily N-acetyltransferase
MIERGWRPGLVGAVVRAHGEYYAREWKFGAFFEAKVAAEMGAFVGRYGARDALFSAWDGNEFLGALTIDGGDPALAAGEAHLRWFIMADAARGQGVGRQLMQAAMAFLREQGFATCYLTTFAGLDAARRLYDAAGFVLESEAEAQSWGTRVREQLFRWRR